VSIFVGRDFLEPDIRFWILLVFWGTEAVAAAYGFTAPSHSVALPHHELQHERHHDSGAIDKPPYDTRDGSPPHRPPIPKGCRVNSSNGVTYDPAAISQRSQQKHAWDTFWKRVYTYLREKCHNLKPKRRLKSGREPGVHNEDYVRTIAVVFEDTNGKEFLRYAQAKLDTGNPKNLISPAFVAKFPGLKLELHNGEVILETPGNGRFTSIARIAGRWSCDTNDHLHDSFQFDPKFMDVEFEVSDTIERFDVVIGSKTIHKEKLLILRPDLGLTGFRTKPPAFKGE
jgi:hypothetical protein